LVAIACGNLYQDGDLRSPAATQLGKSESFVAAARITFSRQKSKVSTPRERNLLRFNDLAPDGAWDLSSASSRR
jgi:hypothetical protein